MEKVNENTGEVEMTQHVFPKVWISKLTVDPDQGGDKLEIVCRLRVEGVDAEGLWKFVGLAKRQPLILTLQSPQLEMDLGGATPGDEPGQPGAK